ncbi:qcr9 subunit 9 of the ubiquinol cytochrome-c reductase complex [Cadophora gregata]|uniref:qcr9 subunit 9 of the ubiquinol cytochrome-c reductase complex n=1 Tax=Cadophora gregata TaxID=51156 RepID=UPI0026DD2864|nr:qcr9 subunit 9 of the ubiquinol cytochrome-c reductase complex [Cadophora gregata]KAK0108502.1 qcr9 subunit 9 of the ubiquinol cytochrome-c reductase complex [Cadophora gregata]
MASASRPIYNLFFRKNYAMLGVVFASAFAFEMVWDRTTDGIWDRLNKGRQWKDIRAKYVESGDDDDE